MSNIFDNDNYKELVSIFEERMKEDNMLIWYRDIYLPDLFAKIAIYNCCVAMSNFISKLGE